MTSGPSHLLRKASARAMPAAFGDALAERTRRRLDAASRVELRMALAVGAELTEPLDFVEGDLLVAAQVRSE